MAIDITAVMIIPQLSFGSARVGMTVPGLTMKVTTIIGTGTTTMGTAIEGLAEKEGMAAAARMGVVAVEEAHMVEAEEVVEVARMMVVAEEAHMVEAEEVVAVAVVARMMEVEKAEAPNMEEGMVVAWEPAMEVGVALEAMAEVVEAAEVAAVIVNRNFRRCFVSTFFNS